MNLKRNFLVQCLIIVLIHFIVIIVVETGDTVPNATIIISLLHEEKVDDAVAKYNNFVRPERKKILAPIITTVYGNNANMFRKLWRFGGSLYYCDDIKVAYENLFQRMKENGHNNKNPEVVLLTGEGPNCIKDFIELNKNLKSSVSAVVEKWALEIQRGEFQPILDFFKRFGSTFRAVYPLQLLLPELLKLTYANSTENFDVLMAFLKAQPWIFMSAITYTELYHLMKESGDGQHENIFKLAYRVKEEIKKTAGKPNWDQKENYKKNTALIAKFPPLIQKLIWSDDLECYIKNVHFKEYLYPDCGQFGEDNKEREVFTWVAKLSKFAEAKWKIIVGDEGKSFKIGRMHWKEKEFDNLYLAVNIDEKDDELRGKIVATEEGRANRNLKWNFVSIKAEENVAAGTIQLRSVGDGYLIYAGNDTNKYDRNRRRVFGLVGTMTKPSGNEWEIDCGAIII